MSKIVVADSLVANALSGLKSTPKLIISQLSPFDEFAGDNDGYHLGDCPSLIQGLPKGESPTPVHIVVLSVVTPQRGEPFLVFYVVCDDNDEIAFPVASVEDGAIDRAGGSLIGSFGPNTTLFGHFHDGDDAYVVYETYVPYGFSGNVGLMNCNVSRTMWATPGELIDGNVIGFSVGKNANRFVAEVGEGVTRLYKCDRFIRSPSVYYVPSDCLCDSTPSGGVCAGDLSYGVVSSLFGATDTHEGDDDGTVSFNLELRNALSSAGVARIVSRDDDVSAVSYCIQSSRTNEVFVYNSATLTSYDVLSVHTCYLTSNSLDAVVVLANKLFIYD